jgi:hypothetical protein
MNPCNRPWSPIGLRDVEAPTFSRQSAHRWRWGSQPYVPAATNYATVLRYLQVRGKNSSDKGDITFRLKYTSHCLLLLPSSAILNNYSHIYNDVTTHKSVTPIITSHELPTYATVLNVSHCAAKSIGEGGGTCQHNLYGMHPVVSWYHKCGRLHNNIIYECKQSQIHINASPFVYCAKVWNYMFRSSRGHRQAYLQNSVLVLELYFNMDPYCYNLFYSW